MDLPDAPLTQEAMDSGAEASLRKFLTQNPDLAPEGALEQLEQTAAEKMAAAVKAEREKAGRGDALLEELKGNQDGKA